MKHRYLYLLLPLLLLATSLVAQARGVLRVEPSRVTKTIDLDEVAEDFEDVTAIVVTNESERTVRLTHQLSSARQPRGWSYRVTDRASSSVPFVIPPGDGERTVSLSPGQSTIYYVVLRPDGVVGKGSFSLSFTDQALPGAVLASAAVSTELGRSTSTQAAATPPTTVRLYPNPAVDRFFVEVPYDVTLGRVEVTNTLGRRIKTFTRPSGEEGYDIEALPEGLYLISVFDDRGKKLKTLRLLHRSYGA